MFGKKTYEIEALKKRNQELEEKYVELRANAIGYKARIETLEYENKDLKDELAKIKPVIKTSGFRPAVSDKCDQCKYAYFSDYDTSVVIGCCKGMVCEDFESSVREEN